MLTSVVFAFLGTQLEYDLVIRDAQIADGTGNPTYFADIALADGKIVQIGFDLGSGREEIDARGKIVAPGFIDVHTHAENVVDLPNAENFVRMGVTSIVIGNCGGSELDIASFFNRITQNPVSVNVATLIGHNTVRRAAMGGNFDRTPSTDELSAMRKYVDNAMKEGAVGLSTGLIYLPGTYSKTEEIVELAKVSAQYKGIYATHMRSESSEIMSAIDEMIAIGRQSGSRVQYSHIKLSGPNMWGKSQDVLKKLELARQSGLELTQDQYSYTASSTSISTLIPDSALEGGTEQFKKRIADPVKKAEIVQYMKNRLSLRTQTSYSYAVIASFRHDPQYNGKNIEEASLIRFGNSDLDSQIETIFWIQSQGGASGVFHGMSEVDVESFMKHPNTMVASDASVREFNEGVPHPRGYGNNARVLGVFVRERNVIRLEESIRKMTSLPAQTFRFKDRGLIKEGMAADIVIFDPQTVSENSTYTQPHAYSSGMTAVIVNGKVVVKNDVHTGARPGVPLRREGYLPQDMTFKWLPFPVAQIPECCDDSH